MSAQLEVHPVRASTHSAVKAVLPEEGTARFDPFLVFHEQGPVHYAPRAALGFPDHPHRGFETITYVIEGEQQHRDSSGHGGTLYAGDVQWMRAGRGVVHSELPTEDLYRNGGLVHALQIWLNLPAARKMEAPSHQDVRAERLPVIHDAKRWVRIIAGSSNGLVSPVDAGRPVLFAHVRLRAGGAHGFDIPPEACVVLYTMRGSVEVFGTSVAARHLAVVRRSPAALTVSAPTQDFEGVLFAALPLHEPVVSRGPFVMNTRREIEQAYDDLLGGTLTACAP